MPKKVTADGERAELVEHHHQVFCDIAIQYALKLMLDSGSCNEMIVDRLLMAAIMHAAGDTSPAGLAKAFRLIAGEIERGVFHSPKPVTGRPN